MRKHHLWFALVALVVGLLAAGSVDAQQQRPSSTAVINSQPLPPPVGARSAAVPMQGKGEGYAYEYRPRTKAQMITFFTDPEFAKQESRVPCDVIISQIAIAQPFALPFESCAAAAKALESPAFKVEPCKNEMFLKDNFLSVTDKKGETFSRWQRPCLPNEQVLTYRNVVLMSTTCLNVAEPAPKPMQQAAATPPAPPVASVAAYVPKYALLINGMSDRNDGFWTSRYESAVANLDASVQARLRANQPPVMPYGQVFTSAPFGDMLNERRSRPRDCSLEVRFLKRAPVLSIQASDSAEVRARKIAQNHHEWQYPAASNVVKVVTVSTGSRGWNTVPVDPSSGFEALTVQPTELGRTLVPYIAVMRSTFEGQSNPIHVWEVCR